jgi:hypothetical protein
MAHQNKTALVITTAPTQRQVTNLLWREIRSIIHRNPWILAGRAPSSGGDASSLLRRDRGRVDCSGDQVVRRRPELNATG